MVSRSGRTGWGGLLVAALLAAGCSSGGGAGTAGEAGPDSAGTVVQEQAGEAAEGVGPVPAPAGPVVEDAGVNGFVDPADDPLSTFATDVDTASYTLARRLLAGGTLPDPAGVRVEEFVNAFSQGYEAPAEGPLGIAVDGAATPFTSDPEARLLRIGLQAAGGAGDPQPSALTFVVDVSGSMADEHRLDLVRRALGLLVSQLGPDDSVAVVVYGDTARVLLPPTPVTQPDAVRGAIDELTPEGSTNAEAGLRLGYDLARQVARPGVTNRVVLASDGIANVGLTDPEALLAAVRADAAAGIELVTVGVGLAGYNDTLMERLANDGDGFSAYVDSFEEAQRLFVEDLRATTPTVARDTKVQVAFDPAAVRRYRLVGYENRAVADGAFRDDTVDAGAVSAGDSVTALYEVVPRGDAAGPLAVVQVRWTDPADGAPRETARTVDPAAVAADWAGADPNLRLDAVVAACAEVLRQSYWASGLDLAAVAGEAEGLTAAFPGDTAVAEFAGLARTAQRLRP